ncbi:MAG: rhamnogalacturonan lyase [Lachnospiraceae bacterium]|nr:rhamnogalacturonan lyase [Lachnospiraceae bacterium]
MRIKEITEDKVVITWNQEEDADSYRVYWADADTPTMKYRLMEETKENSYILKRATHVPHFLKVSSVKNGAESVCSDVLQTPVKKVFHEQLEKLSRGLVAIKVANGIFVSWRLFLDEVKGYSQTGLTGTDFYLYRNGKEIALVTDSTNYLDAEGTQQDEYSVAAVCNGKVEEKCEPVKVWGKEYLDIPIQKPEGGVTPAGQCYEYSANDMSVADVDGDGEYEYIVKWDPSNSHDVSIKGYTGKQYLDCYKLDGTLLWRLDMGVNIRAGAHYTQFMVYDFNGDGKAEMAVKTAPGTKMTIFGSDGKATEEYYITMPQTDLEAGYSHEDNYVCSAKDYRCHLITMFMEWHEHPEVKRGQWPSTLEECFGIEKQYTYPLSYEDAEKLVEYFIHVYAPARSPKNELDQFEGFIYEGPEYLTMFAGDGSELETIPFKYERVDDGLMWGDYAFNRIEPCNRVDRFLSGVAYLDGERPYLIICRGYYTRTTIVAYDFFGNAFHEVFAIDSGFVPMKNPFDSREAHDSIGTDPVYGVLAGQGNHSLATADIDGDGCMEIIYGAAVIDHDGSLLYSSYGYRPDGVYAKLGHGDAMHVARIDPDRPGFEIFNVFEGGAAVPYGFALRDAESGELIFGEYATTDLGRCMIGKIDPNTRGLQVWVKDVFDCKGNKLDVPLLGTNQSIRFAADLTTQVTDGVEYIGTVQPGIVNDTIHGTMLIPENTMTNNGTKGNPCLVADIFGDFREELLLRTEDSSAIRIYMNTDITKHKLFTLMHDTQYRCSVAWQNNCYNQPGYTKYYYGSDMDFKYVLPQLCGEK